MSEHGHIFDRLQRAYDLAEPPSFYAEEDENTLPDCDGCVWDTRSGCKHPEGAKLEDTVCLNYQD